MVRFILAFTIIGIPTLLGIFGFHEWPFSSFSMYSSKVERVSTSEIWITFSDKTEVFLNDSITLWPVGSVWLNFHLKRMLKNGNNDDKFNKIFHYYCERVKKVKFSQYKKQANQSFELSLRRIVKKKAGESVKREILKRYVCK